VARKQADKPVAVEASAPAAPAVHDLTSKEEIALLRKRIAEDQARLEQLLHPPVEFPKWVKDRVFASREEQDAAGPEYAEV
jgi:hypothetical protein